MFLKKVLDGNYEDEREAMFSSKFRDISNNFVCPLGQSVLHLLLTWNFMTYMETTVMLLPQSLYDCVHSSVAHQLASSVNFSNLQNDVKY